MAGMIGFGEVIVVLLGGTLLGGLVAGIIMMAAGSGKRRRGLWVGGLVLLIGSLLLLLGLVAAAVAAYRMLSPARSPGPQPGPISPAPVSEPADSIGPAAWPDTDRVSVTDRVPWPGASCLAMRGLGSAFAAVVGCHGPARPHTPRPWHPCRRLCGF